MTAAARDSEFAFHGVRRLAAAVSRRGFAIRRKREPFSCAQGKRVSHSTNNGASGPETREAKTHLSRKARARWGTRKGHCKKVLMLCAEAHGEDVVALQGEIVEAGGVALPAGHRTLFRAHDVRSGAHLHPTIS